MFLNYQLCKPQDARSSPAVPMRWTFLLFIHHLTKRNKGPQGGAL